MAYIDVKLDMETLHNIDEMIKKSPKQVEKASVLAINRTLDMTKTRLLKNTTEKYAVKRRDLLSGFRLKKANYSNIHGEIKSTGRVLGLDHFKLSPKKRPQRKRAVSVTVLKGNKKSLGNKAFIAYKNGFLGAFKRVSKKALPIERVMGPSVPQMLGNMEEMPNIEKFMGEKLNERFIHELNRLL